MDVLLANDVELSRQMGPAEKLHQALDLMRAGIRIKRAALASAHPGATDSELDAEIERWLFANG